MTTAEKLEKKGEKRGIETGKLEGKLEKAIESAKMMLLKNFDVQTITEITGLSALEIEKLK